MNNADEELGSEVMLGYLQSWGYAPEQKIAVLNKAVAAAGLNAVFKYDADGKRGEFHGLDAERATQFRERLHKVWCGEFNQEARNVAALIAEYREAKVA